MKRIVTFFLTIIMVLTLGGPIICYAENNHRVIRVCYFPLESSESSYGEHAYHDYYYDYLQEIGQHTGWTYEYVDASYSECLEMLANKEIDLVCGIDKTAGRMEQMDFSMAPVMSAKYKLYVLNENEALYYEDYRHFDGMSVGILIGCSQVEALNTLCEEEDFSVQKRYYLSRSAGIYRKRITVWATLRDQSCLLTQ